MSDPDAAAEPADPRGPRPDDPAERVGDAVLNTVVPGYDKKVKGILQDMDAEAAADKTMLETEEVLMQQRPSAEAPGVDIAALETVDPAFDDQDFLTIARDCFERIRQARSQDDPKFADAELSPQLSNELKNVIDGDVASHRHHLLPGLEIRSAVIEAASVTDGKMGIVVRFHLEAEEIDIDQTGKLVAGDYSEREWDEEWTFWRDPSVDVSDIDRALTFVPLDEGGWLVAHRGWIVTAIERVGPPDPLDPSNL